MTTSICKILSTVNERKELEKIDLENNIPRLVSQTSVVNLKYAANTSKTNHSRLSKIKQLFLWFFCHAPGSLKPSLTQLLFWVPHKKQFSRYDLPGIHNRPYTSR